MSLTESLVALGEQNHYGIAFLIAYGTTWSISGIAWRVLDQNWAALVTLFQGMVAFPAALGMSWLIGALGQERPVDDAITQLSILIGASQLLGLPFLVYLYAARQYARVPYAFVAVCSMHFALYSWLYQTSLYVMMSIVLVMGGLVIMLIKRVASSESALASRVCLFTGLTMYVTSAGLALK